ncbi:microcompartments family protein [Clostridium tetani]|uniref:BMC domain-containing protein n=1 Tax=Clostridium tetani TaxID=1513 RepID=A0A4Q0UXX0_CLOTA|nr:BMC domain-containing protein [Clostridium tetani]CDI49602.1 microcompartments family protein [Clostridium tetani 12124569]AVP55240.1 BMC domain-containing protein [Clostridium tetani]KGI39939.1 BMC domain-containing protein [Clostridium tetani ATCC 9441]KGI41446.1 BMC domain-containing protein [Clostridium tetani]KHO39132.1 BMC domain-containing protein [Clostridium tetani]
MARYRALGLIETFGLVFALEAADAMCKAANVELIGYENVASGYISVLVSGDVGACRSAVDAGVAAVNGMEGGNLYSSIVIPSPHEDLEKIIKRYSITTLIPE